MNSFARYFWVSLGIALLAFPLCSHLDKLPIRMYDESRLAGNAFKMIQSGDYLVARFDDYIDLWNTKPPLMIWFQVICIKLLGYNELAIRLPSAIAAFSTAILLWWFGANRLRRPVLGFSAAIILVSFPGYVCIHGTRTGDYDALLTLFMTASLVSLLVHLQTDKPRWLFLTAVALTLGVLTKGVAGLLFLPGILLFLLMSKTFIKVLTTKQTWFGLGFFLFWVVGYYLLRESMAPGYLKAVGENELWGRYSSVLENHRGSVCFYYIRLIKGYASWFYALLPLAFFLGLLDADRQIRRSVLLFMLAGLVQFMIMSNAQTKLDWYILPVYPCIAFLSAVVVDFLARHIQIPFTASSNRSHLASLALPYVLLVLMVGVPYNKTSCDSLWPKEDPAALHEMALTTFLKKACENNIDLTNYCVMSDGYVSDLSFYITRFDLKERKLCLRGWSKLEPGMIAMTRQSHIKEYVKSHYNYELLNEKSLQMYKIISRKDSFLVDSIQK
jgi:4-amino-4-deoxy-L-arabinose transferase-like glycosyltransferase